MTTLPSNLISTAEEVATMAEGHWITDRGSNPPRDPAVAEAACRLLGIKDLREYRPYRESARYAVPLSPDSRLDVSTEVHALVRIARRDLAGDARSEIRDLVRRVRERGGERAVRAVRAVVRQALWAAPRRAADFEILLG